MLLRQAIECCELSFGQSLFAHCVKRRSWNLDCCGLFHGHRVIHSGFAVLCLLPVIIVCKPALSILCCVCMPSLHNHAPIPSLIISHYIHAYVPCNLETSRSLQTAPCSLQTARWPCRLRGHRFNGSALER